MAKKHTAGPWSVGPDIVDENGFPQTPILAGPLDAVCVAIGPDRSQRHANAALIAAAPELLGVAISIHRQLSLLPYDSTSPMGAFRDRVDELVRRVGGAL